MNNTVELDDNALERLARDAGKEMLPMLVAVFCKEARGKAQILSEMTCHQYSEIEALAHSMKSSSATYGALGMNLACVAVENACRQGDLAALTLLKPELVQLTRATIASLEIKYPADD